MDASDLNLAGYFLDARVADGHGSFPAVRTDDRTWSYRDIASLSCRFAQMLEDVDVRPEERVIIALPDGASFVAALFGILRRGAVVVMVNPELPVDQIAYFFELTRTRAVFVHRAYRPAFEQRPARAGARLGSSTSTIRTFSTAWH